MTGGYSYSHMEHGKGRSYDAEFRESPFLEYLWRREQQLLRKLLRREGLTRGRGLRYLDFACGTGRILSALEVEVEESVGLDISSAMMEEARTKVSRSDLVLGNFMDEPGILSGAFDVATAFRFFPNADGPLRHAAAAYLHEHLRPGGLLIVNNHQNAASLLCRLAPIMGKSWPWKPVRNRDLTEVMIGVGFDYEGSRGFGLLPGTARRAYAPIAAHSAVDQICHPVRLDGWAQDVVMWFRRS